MAKGKTSKRKGVSSKGTHSTVNKSVKREMRRDYLDSGMRSINQLNALEKGKDVVMTIANPNPNETNRPFVKVKVSAKQWKELREDGKKKKSAVVA